VVGTPSGNCFPARSEETLRAAAELMRTGGVDAVSTRAVAAAAGVQSPVIYRQFGDKKTLVDAVTRFVFDEYMAEKRRLSTASADPLQVLRRLWDSHVDFGLTNPHCYLLAYVHTGHRAAGACGAQSLVLLQQVVARLADQGRLRLSVDRATTLIHSAAMGAVLTLISASLPERDLLISRVLRDSTLATIVHDEPRIQTRTADLSARAIALRETLDDSCQLTKVERQLLDEWLIRLAESEP
jgi:AcrR family transcriptional regulator